MHGVNLFQTDDRLLDGIARQLATGLNTFFSKERLETAAMQRERTRLARELHDGVLQSLTGAVMQLEALARLVDVNPKGASKRIREIEDLIAEEQRELRCWLRRLTQPTALGAVASAADILTPLRALCRRLSAQSGPVVRLTVTGRGTIPRTLGDEVYRLVQEGFSNVVRHAYAEVCRIEVEIPVADRVRLLIADDGCGFPFRGRYDLLQLSKLRIGPTSLRERVASLCGELLLVSTPTGSRIEITLPLQCRHNHGKHHA